MEKYYSTQQIAQMCHVTRGSVIRWIGEGKLEGSVTAGGHNRVPAGAIVKLLESLRLPIPEELKASPAAAPNRPLKVLIVDDEPSICQLLQLFFEQYFPDYEVREAMNGFDAGMVASRFCPDLILLDLKMPGMDGFEVCQKIRGSAELAGAKILAMTGIEEEGIKRKFFNLGADGYIQKPFDLNQLKNKIETILAAGGERKDSCAA